MASYVFSRIDDRSVKSYRICVFHGVSAAWVNVRHCEHCRYNLFFSTPLGRCWLLPTLAMAFLLSLWFRTLLACCLAFFDFCFDVLFSVRIGGYVDTFDVAYVYIYMVWHWHGIGWEMWYGITHVYRWRNDLSRLDGQWCTRYACVLMEGKVITFVRMPSCLLFRFTCLR